MIILVQVYIRNFRGSMHYFFFRGSMHLLTMIHIHKSLPPKLNDLCFSQYPTSESAYRVKKIEPFLELYLF